MDMNTDYSTTILAISTASLVVITAYYARQTHDLARNQFRPFVFPSITWSSQNEIDFDLFLCLKNIGTGAAYSIRVENSVNGAKNSQQEWMVGCLNIPRIIPYALFKMVRDFGITEMRTGPS
jgi:hypothetical protein